MDETGSGRSVPLATILGLGGGGACAGTAASRRAPARGRLPGGEIAYIPRGGASGMNREALIRRLHAVDADVGSEPDGQINIGDPPMRSGALSRMESLLWLQPDKGCLCRLYLPDRGDSDHSIG